MQNFLVKSAKLIAEPEKASSIINGLLLHLPGGNGSIFSLVKIMGRKDEKRQKIVKIIGEHLSRFHEVVEEGVNIPRRFEQVLQAINDDIATHISNSSPIPLADLHAIVGVVHKNQIFFSGIGDLSALFMHQTGKKRYVIYELEKQFDPLENLTWQKPFLTVLDGELNPGDLFYCASKISGREMSLGELQEILVTLPPSGALKRIQQYVNFGGLYGAIAFKVVHDEEAGKPKKINPIASMEEWNNTKDQTAAILGEQKPDFKLLAEKLSNPIIKRLSAPGSTGYKSTIKSIISTLVKFIAIITVLAWTLLKKLFYILKKLITFIFKAISNEEKRKLLKNKISSALHKIKNISKTSKYIALGAALTIILLVGSIFFIQSGAEKKLQNETFVTIIQTIEDKADGAEASLIYDDKNQAKSLLGEATSLLDSLDASTKTQEEQIYGLSQRLDKIFYKLRGVTEIEPISVASIEDGEIAGSVEADGSIYTFSADSIYKLTQPDLNLVKLDITSGSIGMPKTATGQGANFLFIDSGGNLGIFNSTQTTINPLVSGTTNQNSAEDFVLYNENLYVLSAADQQVLKMRPQGNGYDAGTDWIQIRETDLGQSRSIAIDGDVYILTDTKIARFTSGREINFILDAVEPSLKNPTDLWTTVGTDYLYILEPDEQRIVIFKKDGSLVAQYVCSALATSTSIVVDEPNNAIYFTDSKTVYKIPAQHLLQ
ncbi:hypothetical protein KJ766_03105 [Patescibacteria group bacterium]|nr:hypothetical protein [Patescibacteria group bacterium]